MKEVRALPVGEAGKTKDEVVCVICVWFSVLWKANAPVFVILSEMKWSEESHFR